MKKKEKINEECETRKKRRGGLGGEEKNERRRKSCGGVKGRLGKEEGGREGRG